MDNIPSRIEKSFYGLNPKPEIILTTGRRPSQRTRTFIKELNSVLPNTLKVTRGHLSLEDLNSLSLEYKIKEIILVSDYRGNPGRFIIFSSSYNSKKPELVSEVLIKGLSLRKELGLHFNKKVIGSAIYSNKEDNIRGILDIISNIFRITIIYHRYIPRDFSILKPSIEFNKLVLTVYDSDLKLIGPIIKIPLDTFKKP
ncbi:MAG: Brix domain-containing protein [Caldisphaera sp.]|nr:hypothetical protein [Caldisphaera sp.]PMP60979.1 MAG: hypothetical protein C0201_01310 [Caldisphaera sp.]